MAYENILNAVKSSKLTPAQEIENYSAFSELQKQGVYLPDMVKKMSEFDEMKKRLDELSASKPSVDAELFAVMEQAVKGDEHVRDARARMNAEKSRILTEMCMRDEGFRRASDEYRRAVNAAYIASKEGRSGE